MPNERTDRDWIIRAYRAATKSPDPSTQNGAVIPYPTHGAVYRDMFRDGNYAVIEHCNTFPPGVESKPERLERPLKYNFIEHAERNVILQAARQGIPLDGLTMYVPWFACADCSRAIICAGIKRVVGHQKMMDATPDHWKESIAHAMTMLGEAGVGILLVMGDLPEAPKIRFNGQIWQP